MHDTRSSTFIAALTLVVFGTTSAPPARADDETFAVGSLVIPMDNDYQDDGMLQAFGLLYTLLRADVPVAWVIAPEKQHDQIDFTTSAVDVATEAVITDHGYRGGPFVVNAVDATRAGPIVDLWIADHFVTVHRVTTAFEAHVRRHLVAAPTIAVFADGHEDIAFRYLNAAAITDSNGQRWPSKDGSTVYAGFPDVLDVGEIAGPTTTSHHDGALFDAEANPRFCQLMTMHWGVNEVVDEVVAEVRDYLAFPTHFFAECQAVNAIENNAFGHFLTPNGFLIAAKPSALDYHNADFPFAQLDGAMTPIGGSEPAYSLPVGDSYKDVDIVMVTAKGTPIGVQDVWMTGYIDGRCRIVDDANSSRPRNECLGFAGKVSYLGGHAYDTKLPMSDNPKTQGARLFLNSLFEADCASAEGQPLVRVTKRGPATVSDGLVTYDLTVTNFGPGSVLDVVLTDPLPTGATPTVVPAGATYDEGSNTIVWDLGSLAAGVADTASVTVTLAAAGTYENQAEVSFRVGLNGVSQASATVVTYFGGDADQDGCPDDLEQRQGTRTDLADTDDDGFDDCDDICPVDANPLQSPSDDPANCGACGNVCALDHALAICDGGECVIGACEADWTDADHVAATGCEVACTPIAETDATCDGVDDDCDGVADDEWSASTCGIGACVSSSACVDGELLACTPRAPGVEGAAAIGTCNNGADDDCDDHVDDDDPGCEEPVVEPEPEPGPESAAEDDADDGDTGTGPIDDVDAGNQADGAGDTSGGDTSGSDASVTSDTASGSDAGPDVGADVNVAAEGSGCGCRTGGGGGGDLAGALLVLAALVVLARRRPAHA